MINCMLYKQVVRDHLPMRNDILKWIKSSLIKDYTGVDIEVLIVDSETSRQKNFVFRNKDYATNVISLEYCQNREKFNLLRGELILCDDVIISEASSQGKDITAHYAHLVIHGMLHLQGMDHIDDCDAKNMEALEVKLMDQLGFLNPYI